MQVNLSRSNVYVLGNLLKSDNGIVNIDGSINVGGNMNVGGGLTTVTLPSWKENYSIACVGSLILRDGRSNKQIYYKSTKLISSSWDDQSYEPYQYNNLPAAQADYDIRGYLKYLLSLASTGTVKVVSSTCTLSGRRTKSINIFDISDVTLSSIADVDISIGSSASALIQLNRPSGNVAISNLTVTGNIASENVILAVDSSAFVLTNCTIRGTIYAPESNVVLSNCTVHGAVYAKSLTIQGNCELRNNLFSAYIEYPTAPKITVSPVSSLGNYSAVSVEVDPVDGVDIPSYYEIRYSLDGKEPTRDHALYTGPVSVYGGGVVTFKAKVFGNGVDDGVVASQAYGFNCKAPKPTLISSFDSITGVTTYSFDYESDEVFYSIDGGEPDTKYDPQTFNEAFSSEGEYTIRYVGRNEGCDDSDLADDVIIVELPVAGVSIPQVVVVNGSNGQVLYTAPSNALPPSEILVPGTYTYAALENIYVYFVSNGVTKVKYTVDGTNPVTKGVEYSSGIKLKGIERLKAFGHVDFVQYSKQIDVTFTVSISNSKTFDIQSLKDRSEEIIDSLQQGSSYAIDIAWVGPGVVTDDFAVYQALINILATGLFERIFNPRFGISLISKIAEIDSNTDTGVLLDQLKYEVESQDPRIKVDGNRSDIYYDDRYNAIVADIVWTNLLTNNSAAVKYAYDLDTIL